MSESNVIEFTRQQNKKRLHIASQRYSSSKKTEAQSREVWKHLQSQRR
jgi:hypothetical protein